MFTNIICNPFIDGFNITKTIMPELVVGAKSLTKSTSLSKQDAIQMYRIFFKKM